MKANVLGAKLRLYGAICWGLLILFSFLGALLHKPAAPYVLLISVVMWTALRMLSEAREAVALLGMIKRVEKETKDLPSGDDDLNA